MSVYRVFPGRAKAKIVLRKIAATPALESGIGPVWVWYHPDSDAHVIDYSEGGDGRCMVAQTWPAVARDCMEAYVLAWPGVLIRCSPWGLAMVIAGVSGAPRGSSAAASATDPTRSVIGRGAWWPPVTALTTADHGGKEARP